VQREICTLPLFFAISIAELIRTELKRCQKTATVEGGMLHAKIKGRP